jgi:hypothetical protein
MTSGDYVSFARPLSEQFKNVEREEKTGVQNEDHLGTQKEEGTPDSHSDTDRLSVCIEDASRASEVARDTLFQKRENNSGSCSLPKISLHPQSYTPLGGGGGGGEGEGAAAAAGSLSEPVSDSYLLESTRLQPVNSAGKSEKSEELDVEAGCEANAQQRRCESSRVVRSPRELEPLQWFLWGEQQKKSWTEEGVGRRGGGGGLVYGSPWRTSPTPFSVTVSMTGGYADNMAFLHIYFLYKYIFFYY